MRLLRYVAPRLTGGMKSNTINTHLGLHIHDDILNFGVQPEVMDSSYAEPGHITISKGHHPKHTEVITDIHCADCPFVRGESCN
jgi:hypothetical protein